MAVASAAALDMPISEESFPVFKREAVHPQLGAMFVLAIHSPIIPHYLHRYVKDVESATSLEIFEGRRQQYVAELMHAIRSLRRYNPSGVLSVTLVTDASRDELSEDLMALFDNVFGLASPPSVPWGEKDIAMLQTPYERTLLLDADVTTCGDLTPAFDVVDDYDIAMVQEPFSLRTIHKIYKGQAGPSDLPFSNSLAAAHRQHDYNSGVIVYRTSPQTERLIRLLQNREGDRRSNQQRLNALMRNATDVRRMVLPPEYNFRVHHNTLPVWLIGPVLLIHTRLAAAPKPTISCETVNAVTSPRLYDYQLGIVLHLTTVPADSSNRYTSLPPASSAPKMEMYRRQVHFNPNVSMA